MFMRMRLGVLFFVLIALSCGSVNSKMNKSLDNVYQGMTIQEFKQKVSKATLVQMMDNYSCYKYTTSSAKFGEQGGY